jgi:hypothetical protein
MNNSQNIDDIRDFAKLFGYEIMIVSKEEKEIIQKLRNCNRWLK